jgi:RHS repeat-associated protein
VTGEYNGSTTTAGSYDPYTGNAKRVIDDLTVTGSIGEYPLKWMRTLNTRGGGDGWRHNYSWGLTVQEIPGQCGQGCICDGPHGTVSYPDGRVMNLRWEDGDQAYVQADGWEPMGDRVVHVEGGSGHYYDLRLKDGGRVEFRPASGIPAGAATAIVDPYGRRTTLEYTGGQASKLWKVTEPGGRFLQISYDTHCWQNQVNPPQQVCSDVIKQVEAHDGLGHIMEKAIYTYEEVHAQGPFFEGVFLQLTQVDYGDGSHAYYAYNASALAIPNNPWSFCAGTIKTCHDVRFAGPMSKIEYEYALPGGGQAGAWIRGQIKAERNMTTPQVVSSVDYQAGLADRTEIRPDGATRHFSYRGWDGLDSYTDFAYPGETAHNTTINFIDGASGNPDHYLRMVTDARGHTTSTEKEKKIGAVMAVIHHNQSRVKYAYSQPEPYYLISKTDESEKTTYYDRDGANRIWQIRYPDGGVETFAYEGNPFGLVQKHGLTSGGVEEFRYDGRGLKTLSWLPATESDLDPSAHPTHYYYYFEGNTPTGRFDLLDRLQLVVDPLGNHTWYDYNKRGQVTRVTHHDGTYTQTQYNADGTLAWTADENHPGAETDVNQRTRYEYDEYKRVTKVTNPLGKETNNSYAPWNGQGAFSHTTSSVYLATTHSQKKIGGDYDSNFRLIETIQGWNTADAAKTTNTYDEVGNLKTMKDPKGQSSGLVTTYDYDHRNRRTRVTDTLNHPTTWEYDDAGNMKKETRADNKSRTWDLYDAMNRVKQTTGFLGAVLERTNYDYDTAGNLITVTDPNHKVYQTGYDQLNRKKSFTHPTDTPGSAQYELWRYDIAGNLLWSRNPASQYKHFEYDNRNRQRLSYWNNSENPETNPAWSIGPKVAITPDPASRILEIKTNNGETIVAFGYDNADHKIWEDQTVAGFTRRVATDPDDDGNRRTLSVSNVPGGYSFTYEYTPREQLKQINRSGSSHIEFSYDPNGNLTRRQNMAQGQARDATRLQYDDLNRVTICEQTGYYDETFARSNYNDYDLVNNLKSISRHEDGDTGELFTYDDANQLSSVSYKADVVPHAPGGAPGGAIAEVEQDGQKETLAALAADPEREPLAKDSVEIESVSGPRTVTYQNDAINRLSMDDPNIGPPTIFTPNHLNQYTSVTGHGALNYDGNLNVSGYDGWAFVHDSEKRLLSVTGNGHSAQFAYDGLGRCVKRTIDGATTLFTYDGWKPVAEWTGAGAFLAWNLYGVGADENLLRFQQNPAGYLHYHLDAMGNVQFLLSDQPESGLEKYTYDVFGKPTITGWNGDVRPISNHGNRFLFTGREYLYTFGLYDYRHRTYHPGLGRFIQTDPLGLKSKALSFPRHRQPCTH